MKKKTRTIVCPICRGSGKAVLFMPIGLLSMPLKCPRCRGTGILVEKVEKEEKKND